jgi:TolB-like protein/Flp pilus assembly protein TadD
MKRCLTCKRVESDEALKFCRVDGSRLVSDTPDLESSATLTLPSLPRSADLPTSQLDSTASIAVLPFVNMSADPENEYFCDGLAEELINGLTKIQRLRVLARTSSFSFKGKQVDVAEIGQRLNVSAVLEGSVRKAGNRLRITAQLINVADGYHLWSERYDRQIEDLFQIQDEVTLAVVDALKLKLLSKEKASLLKQPTENTEAYQLYLKGRYYWHQRTEEAVNKGIECFEQAIAFDPNYAVAYAGLADSYSLLGLSEYGALPPAEAFPKAKQASLAALEKDKTLAEAHVSLAFARMYFDWDLTHAEMQYERATELNPNYATAHHFRALNFMAMGRADLSITEIEKAQALEPLSLIINTNLGWMLYFARQYEQAIEQYEKTLEMDKNFYPARFRLGQAHLQAGSIEQAVDEFEKAVTLSDRKARPLALLGYAHGLSGNRTGAERLLVELNELSKKRYVSALEIARIYLALGDTDQVFDCFNKALEEREGWMIWLKVEPSFDGLRSDPRFADFIRRVRPQLT